MNLYLWLKFVHVAAAVLWVGGAAITALFLARGTLTADRGVVHAMLQHGNFYGRSVAGPASGIALLAGGGMLWVAHMPMATLWVEWGLAGMLVHFVMGGWFIRRANERYDALVGTPEASAAALESARRQLVVLTTTYTLLLLSVVGAMTLKPTL